MTCRRRCYVCGASYRSQRSSRSHQGALGGAPSETQVCGMVRRASVSSPVVGLHPLPKVTQAGVRARSDQPVDDDRHSCSATFGRAAMRSRHVYALRAVRTCGVPGVAGRRNGEAWPSELPVDCPCESDRREGPTPCVPASESVAPVVGWCLHRGAVTAVFVDSGTGGRGNHAGTPHLTSITTEQ
jgi:hypothetical protein